ncbi:MAG: hypothetical protein JAZ06_03290 [Candidatus Thiodiazotropha taylori]|nr:hypothetical protein [Candidatus Thiodiazotropha taylori]
MDFINHSTWIFIRKVAIALILLFTPPLSLIAEAEGWIDREGNPLPNADNMKSVDGFGGWLIVTPDHDWESKWNTPPETTPHFSEASEVAYGEKLTILTIFGNPKVNESGNINIRCDIQVLRPDGSASADMEDIDCAVGKLQGNPRNVRLTQAIISFVGEESDPAGTWIVNVTLTDRNRRVSLPLTSKFELSRDKVAKSNPFKKFRFKSQEDVGKWMMYYYMNPEPDVLVEAMEYMSVSGLLDNKNAMSPIFGFLAGVFSENPKRVPEWIDKLGSLKESHFGVVVPGLWYANLPNSEKQVYKIFEEHPNLKKQFSFVENGLPMDVEKIPLKQGAWVLDALWGKFFSNGNKEPVVRIMTTLPWLDVKGDVNRLVIGGSASWSLTSNAVQHERVMQFCEEELENQPEDVVEKLNEVIANAKKEEL